MTTVHPGLHVFVPDVFDKKILKSFWLTWQTEFYMEWKSLNSMTLFAKFGKSPRGGLG